MIQGKKKSGKDNINGTVIPFDGILELKKNTVISPCCKLELHFKIWNNLVRLIENGFYPCKCSKCHKQYHVVAPKDY
jgi:hypothetical protein